MGARSRTTRSALVFSLWWIVGGCATSGVSGLSSDRPVDVVELTAEQIRAGLAAGEYTAADLTRAFLERIALYEDRYNAMISINPDALAIADALDEEYRSSGAPRPPPRGAGGDQGQPRLRGPGDHGRLLGLQRRRRRHRHDPGRRRSGSPATPGSRHDRARQDEHARFRWRRHAHQELGRRGDAEPVQRGEGPRRIQWWNGDRGQRELRGPGSRHGDRRLDPEPRGGRRRSSE